MVARISSELVPAALALGWVPLRQQPARKGERRFGEFEFERVAAERIEHMGFDFQYGDHPDIWLCLALWTGEAGVCTLFRSGNCRNYSERREPLWRRVLSNQRRESPPRDVLAGALANGLRCLQLAEGYFREGVEHPHLRLTQTLPPYRWPEGYEERMK
jgi:hypothetical protein